MLGPKVVLTKVQQYGTVTTTTTLLQVSRNSGHASSCPLKTLLPPIKGIAEVWMTEESIYSPRY
jgi:hypothetical protein